MNSENKLTPILFKASGFATVLFWILILSENKTDDSFIIIIAIVSIIPISIVCSITILFTIIPFLLIEKNKISNSEIYKKYFPYYSIVIFGICIYHIINSNFEPNVSAFFATAFFTLMQSWFWICKKPTIQKQIDLINKKEVYVNI